MRVFVEEIHESLSHRGIPDFFGFSSSIQMLVQLCFPKIFNSFTLFCYNVSCLLSTAKTAPTYPSISIFQNPKGKEPFHLGVAHIFCCLL